MVGLRMPPPQFFAQLKNRLLMEERNYNRVALAEDHVVLVSKLNTNQNMIYTSVLEAYSEDKQVLMFVYGHGGNGHCITSAAHRKDDTFSLLIETALIIWDVAPMNDRPCFESLDKNLQDILDEPTRPFGGKSVLLGGDFRQTLPIKPKGTKMDIVSSSKAKSSLWRHFRICKLSQNMRLLQPKDTYQGAAGSPT
ncbi:DNA helicase [Tanacetum coccineum]